MKRRVYLASIAARSLDGAGVPVVASRLPRSRVPAAHRSCRPRYPELRMLVLAHPDATLPEHAERLERATGVRLSPSHLSRLLRRVGLRLKKRV